MPSLTHRGPLPGGLRAPGEGPVELSYERPDPEHLRLEGELEGERVVVALKRVPEPPSLLRASAPRGLLSNPSER